MPVPTTNVSLSSIQTEFGGANPISLSEYYRGAGGGYVPGDQSTSGTDGVAISTSGLIRVGMFRGLTKTAGGYVSTAGGMLSQLRVGASAATATLNILTDGTFTGSFAAGGLNGNGALGDLYYSPATAGIGNTTWVRYTLSSGLAPNIGSLVAGTWYQLSTQRSIGYNSGTGGAISIRSGTIALSFSTSASGSPIVASCSYSFDVERES